MPDQERTHFHTVVGSHKEPTIIETAKALGLSFKRNEVVGYNAEGKDEHGNLIKEPESESPIVPVLFKLMRIHQLSYQLGFSYDQILVSDVVWSKDGVVVHRPPDIRDTLNGAQDFTEAMIAYMLSMYPDSFNSTWKLSLGIGTPKKNGNARFSSTEEVIISGDYPRLKPKLLEKKKDLTASPLVKLIELAKQKKVQLKMWTEGSDKKKDISYDLAYQLIVKKTMLSKEMADRIRKEYKGADKEQEYVDTIDMHVDYRKLPMDRVMRWLRKEAA